MVRLPHYIKEIDQKRGKRRISRRTEGRTKKTKSDLTDVTKGLKVGTMTTARKTRIPIVAVVWTLDMSIVESLVSRNARVLSNQRWIAARVYATVSM